MDVAIRRSGVPLYTIGQVRFPVSLSFLQGRFQKRLVKQKVSSGSVPDISCLKGDDATPPKEENEGGYRVSGGREREIDVRPALQQISTNQGTPETRNTKASRKLTEL
jgi:hypothetical protein